MSQAGNRTWASMRKRQRPPLQLLNSDGTCHSRPASTVTSSALLPTTAPYVPPAKPGAQQGTESKGLSPSRQPEFTSTQTSSASRAERCSVGRKGEESRDGSEQTPHKAHDMQLENSSKICFPAASPKSTPSVQCCLSLRSSLMSHLCILGQVWPISALIPQLNQSSAYFPPVSGSLPSQLFLEANIKQVSSSPEKC